MPKKKPAVEQPSLLDVPAEPQEPGYKGPEVCKIVGITYRQLDYWARTDLLKPSISDAQGSGTQRVYSYRDLVTLKVIKSLLDAGVSLQSTRTAIEYLRNNMGADVASASLVLQGSTSVLVQSGEEIVDLVRKGQGVFNIVPLGSVVDELDENIVAFNPAAAPANASAPRARAAGGASPAR